MTPEQARALVAQMPGARERWLAGMLERVRARAVWLAGSAGRGRTDEWSDLDLILVDGAPVLDEALLAWENPGNGPVGGGYFGSLFAVGPLTLWVDWYLWPADAPTPSDARLLHGEGTPGDLDLSRSLDRLGRGRPRPHADRDAFALAMLPLAAKFVARGQDDKAAGMAAMLGAAPGMPPLTALRTVFDAIGGADPGRDHAEARRLVERYLEVVEALGRN